MLDLVGTRPANDKAPRAEKIGPNLPELDTRSLVSFGRRKEAPLSSEKPLPDELETVEHDAFSAFFDGRLDRKNEPIRIQTERLGN